MGHMDTAFLGNFDQYTTFSNGGKTLTFRTCDGLERYTRVLKWDAGYLVVMAKYKHQNSEIEEYIDLEPVLERLYMDKEAFLKPIKKVRLASGLPESVIGRARLSEIYGNDISYDS